MIKALNNFLLIDTYFFKRTWFSELAKRTTFNELRKTDQFIMNKYVIDLEESCF